MESQSVFIPCGGVPAETTHYICFKIACLDTGALQPWEQAQGNYCAISLLSLAWEDSHGFSQWSFQQHSHTGLSHQWKYPVGLSHRWLAAERYLLPPENHLHWQKEKRAETYAGVSAFEFHVGLVLRNLAKAFALFLSKMIIFCQCFFLPSVLLVPL